jgi:hypothetical protein
VDLLCLACEGALLPPVYETLRRPGFGGGYDALASGMIIV